MLIDFCLARITFLFIKWIYTSHITFEIGLFLSGYENGFSKSIFKILNSIAAGLFSHNTVLFLLRFNEFINILIHILISTHKRKICSEMSVFMKTLSTPYIQHYSGDMYKSIVTSVKIQKCLASNNFQMLQTQFLCFGGLLSLKRIPLDAKIQQQTMLKTVLVECKSLRLNNFKNSYSKPEICI